MLVFPQHARVQAAGALYKDELHDSQHAGTSRNKDQIRISGSGFVAALPCASPAVDRGQEFEPIGCRKWGPFDRH